MKLINKGVVDKQGAIFLFYNKDFIYHMMQPCVCIYYDCFKDISTVGVDILKFN